MAKATKEQIAELEGLIDNAAGGLTKVEGKRMFGCHALFADGAVFGLVWKEGRIGVRLPDERAYAALMDLAGATPWKAGPMVMSHWVLVPPAMHRERSKLSGWLVKAHALALAGGGASIKKKAKKAAKKTAKKSAKKTASARRKSAQSTRAVVKPAKATKATKLAKKTVVGAGKRRAAAPKAKTATKR